MIVLFETEVVCDFMLEGSPISNASAMADVEWEVSEALGKDIYPESRPYCLVGQLGVGRGSGPASACSISWVRVREFFFRATTLTNVPFE